MQAPHLLILGHGESGKSTLAAFISQITGMGGCASSKFMAPLVAEKLNYASAEEAWADRRNRREEWKQIIVDYRANDPARVVRELYTKFNIYEGLRVREEFECALNEGLFDLIIYVDRGHWEGNRWHLDIPLDPTMDMHRGDAHVVIENSGTREQFEVKCCQFASFLRNCMESGFWFT